MSNLDWQGAVEDVKSAAISLRASGSKKVGATGFCMGGALSLAGAVRFPEVIDCAAPFYGIPSKQLADPSKATVPIQGHYGDKDTSPGFSDPAAAAALEEALKSSPAAANCEVFHYPTVGHAFMNATEEGKARRSKLGQGEHDQAAVDLAWTRVFGFFKMHLSE